MLAGARSPGRASNFAAAAPPALSPQEDALKEVLGEWIERADWFRYVPGKAR